MTVKNDCMGKDTFYFTHDYNSRQDEKIKQLIRQYGLLGYGIFWAIVEDLYNNANALRTDYKGIAYDLHSDEITIKSIINDFGLFIIDDGYFGSLSIERRLNERLEKSKKARDSALCRWNKVKANANAMQTQCEGNARKESKGNKEKEREYSSNNAHARDFEKIGLEVRKAYADLPIEFTSRYTENFYKSWLSINSYLDENCKFLRMWENQLTVSEYKKIFDRAEKKEFSILQAKQALTELDASRHAKDKYNSVFHGFNTFIRTILKNV